MYKLIILLFLTISLIASPAMAEKATQAGKANPSAENRNLHRPAMDQKETEKKRDDASEIETEKEKNENKKAKNEGKSAKQSAKQSDDKIKGLEKQEAKKSEQVQKELGKGSERGQEARQDRRKWWKFWGEKE